MEPTAPLHVVFGSGQIGAQLAAHLVARGMRVRVVRRSDKPVPPGVERFLGDARDPRVAMRAAASAQVLYHCMNPSEYSAKAWERELPALGESLIRAALAQGARLVCLDNLYAYGDVPGRRTESTSFSATGRKGRVRAAWTERLREAARTEGLRFVVGKAGDFFGPGAEGQSLASMAAFSGLLAGKSVWIPGDPTAPHAFSYAPDVARGLAALGEASSDVEGQVFHLPVIEIAPKDLFERVGTALGVRASVHAVPRIVFTALGVVVPLFRNLLETMYQWEKPFLASDTAFRTRFPGVATAPEAAIDAIVERARAGSPRALVAAPR